MQADITHVNQLGQCAWKIEDFSYETTEFAARLEDEIPTVVEQMIKIIDQRSKELDSMETLQQTAEREQRFSKIEHLYTKASNLEKVIMLKTIEKICQLYPTMQKTHTTAICILFGMEIVNKVFHGMIDKIKTDLDTLKNDLVVAKTHMQNMQDAERQLKNKKTEAQNFLNSLYLKANTPGWAAYVQANQASINQVDEVLENNEMGQALNLSKQGEIEGLISRLTKKLEYLAGQKPQEATAAASEEKFHQTVDKSQ